MHWHSIPYKRSGSCRWISHFREKSLSERRCTGIPAPIRDLAPADGYLILEKNLCRKGDALAVLPLLVRIGRNWSEFGFFGKIGPKKCLNWCPKVWFLPKLAYLTTHPELDYWTFIHGMSAWQAQGSPDVKLFAKRVWLYLMVRFWSDFLGKWGLILVQIWIDRVWFQKWEHCTVVVRD